MSYQNEATNRFTSIEALSAKLDGNIVERSEHITNEYDTSQRAKTRFLNYDFTAKNSAGPQKRLEPDGVTAKNALAALTIIDGIDQGRVYNISNHLSSIGRADDQDIQLPDVDDAISREAHASIAYYGEHSGFVIRDGMKPNPVLLNGSNLSGERALTDGDVLQIGETRLLFSC